MGIVAAVGVGGLLVWGFIEGRAERVQESQREAPVKAPSLVSRGPGGETVLTLDVVSQRRIGLVVEALTATTARPEVAAYGSLEEDPAESLTLRAPVAGTLRRTEMGAWPAIGQRFAAGATVGLIVPRFAPADRVNLDAQLTAARADVAAVTASLEADRAALQRARTLNAEDKIVSDQALQAAEAKVKADEAQLRSATERVRLIGAALSSATGPGGPMPLSLPRAGEVVQVLAEPGEAVESGQPIVRVARFDRLLARIAIPPGEPVDGALSGVRLVVVGHEDRPQRGRRVALGAAVSPQARGEVLLFRVSPDGVALRPGQAVTAYLAAYGEPRAGVVIPRSAVVRQAGAAWAYVQSGGDRFSRRPVLLDHPVDGGWLATSSFQTGDRVVITGAQQLLSEELKYQIQLGD